MLGWASDLGGARFGFLTGARVAATERKGRLDAEVHVVAQCDCYGVDHRGFGRFVKITGDSAPLRVLAIKVYVGVTVMRRNVREVRGEEPNRRIFSRAEPVSQMLSCCIASHGLRRVRRCWRTIGKAWWRSMLCKNREGRNIGYR